MNPRTQTNCQSSPTIVGQKTNKQKKLNAWLLMNQAIMRDLTVKEPVCWSEVDTPG